MDRNLDYTLLYRVAKAYYLDQKTQQEIASYLGMQRSVYRRYGSGERETPAWVIVALADLYRVSTDYLLGRSKEQAPGSL